MNATRFDYDAQSLILGRARTRRLLRRIAGGGVAAEIAAWRSRFAFPGMGHVQPGGADWLWEPLI